MSETFFPLTDLLRRKFQTSLVAITLALSVASTLSLLLFCDRIGFGLFSAGEIMTLGLTAIFSQFVTFIEILIFSVGAVVVTFVAFLMMTQRARDIGLMKAAGCPSGLVAGYFMTQLLLVTLVGCTVGTLSGIMIDYAVSHLVGFQFIQGNPNYWLIPLVFVTFFVLALAFGAKPIVDAARMSPMKALSPLAYFGLSAAKEFKPLSSCGLSWRLSYRSLVRRQSATLRIVVLLTMIFLLSTVVVAGGTIASDTTISWIENPSGGSTIAVAHIEMATQYALLESKFFTVSEYMEVFNYSDERFVVSADELQLLNNIPGVSKIDPCLIFEERIREIGNFTIDPETLETLPVGDSREDNSLIIGCDPETVSFHSIRGRTIGAGSLSETVIGDSIAHSMFSPNPSRGIVFSDPLAQSVGVRSGSFTIVGISVDPINNGRVIYVPIQKLANLTEMAYPNIVFVTVEQTADFALKVAEIRSIVTEANPELDIVGIADLSKENVNFLASIWSIILYIPLLILASAALCLTGYMAIAIDEQKTEFAIMRAIGGKPRLVLGSLGIQSSIVLLSGFGIGVSLGIVTTLIVLMANPLVSSWTVLEIAAWLFSALVGIFIISLIPAFGIAKSPVSRNMT